MGPVQLARHYRKAREGGVKKSARHHAANGAPVRAPRASTRRRSGDGGDGERPPDVSSRALARACPDRRRHRLAHGRGSRSPAGNPPTPAAVPPLTPDPPRTVRWVRPPTGPRPGRRATLNVGRVAPVGPPADPAGGPARGLPAPVHRRPDSADGSAAPREVRLLSGRTARRTPCVDHLITGRMNFALNFSHAGGTSLPSRRLTVWGHPCLARTFLKLAGVVLVTALAAWFLYPSHHLLDDAGAAGRAVPEEARRASQATIHFGLDLGRPAAAARSGQVEAHGPPKRRTPPIAR